MSTSHDVFTCVKFPIEIFMGYYFTVGRIFDFTIDFCMGLTIVIHVESNYLKIVLYRKNTDKMTSMLLMLVVLGAFICSSQAVKCYSCAACDEPKGECTGEVCVKVTGKADGAFMVFS